MFQIRVKNQHVLGNWSDPVLIPIDNTCISTSPIVQSVQLHHAKTYYEYVILFFNYH